MSSYGTSPADALNLLRGQMIAQMLVGGLTGALSLTEFILGQVAPARRTGRDMMHDALTGLMRSDAAMLRQGAMNLNQGRALLETGSRAVSGIEAKVARMKDLAAMMPASGTPEYTEYGDLAADIASLIAGTQFNGLSILDSSAWAQAGIQLDGAVGKISVQAGKSPLQLTLYDLEPYKTAFDITDLDSTTSAAAAAASLDQFSSLLAGMKESYEARAGLLASEGTALQRQADILDEATGKAGTGGVEALREALINILMRESGAVLNGIS
jgi:flagellin